MDTPESCSPETWLRAGVAALRRGGVDAVRVEVLARDLGVSKGSFYWHYRDRRALLDALLALWEAETTYLVREAAARPTSADRLTGFFALVDASRAYPPDTAIFELARRHPELTPRVTATEGRRIAFFAEQFIALGLADAAARQAAEVVYYASLGWLEHAHRSGRGVTGFPAFITAAITAVLEGVSATAVP